VGDKDVVVESKVDLGKDAAGGFMLSVAMTASIAGVEQGVAEDLVQGAHAICPYSNAIKGNIDVAISVTTH
jgi:organic hydroperoxide reductase OsmC/OhrA